MTERLQRLLVVTPEHVAFDGQARLAVFPGTGGDLGILPDHAPLVAVLRAGLVRIRRGERELILVISGGLLEVRNNQATVLAGAAEQPDEIDPIRAQTALERAERRLASRGSEIDLDRAREALLRAAARLRNSRG